MPRAGLSTARVTAEAADLADEVGWTDLTLAGVAARCGVRLPSLYKHIPSLDALRLEVSALSIRELGAALTAAVLGRSGREALLALATAYRTYAHAHPGRYASTVAAPRGDHRGQQLAAAETVRVVEATLSGYGLSGDDAIDATRALRAALHGFVDIEAHDGFGLPVDVDRSYARLVDGLEATLSTWSSSQPRR